MIVLKMSSLGMHKNTFHPRKKYMGFDQILMRSYFLRSKYKVLSSWWFNGVHCGPTLTLFKQYGIDTHVCWDGIILYLARETQTLIYWIHTVCDGGQAFSQYRINFCCEHGEAV